MKLPAYPRTKPSGVEWLGDVPEHWEVKRLKTSAICWVSNVDKVHAEDELPVRLCNYTDVYYHDHITPDMELMETTATADEIRRFGLREGDVIITKDSEEWSDIAVPALVKKSAPDLVCGYHLAIIRSRPKALLGDYLLRAFQSCAVNQQFQVAASGVTRYGLPKASIGDAWIPLPAVAEQRAIAAFLDRETGRVDRLVAKKRELIERLKEKRTALISRTVTRGLPPAAARLPDNPPLKPSALDSLGDIPKHWEVKKLKYLASHETDTGIQIGPFGGMLTELSYDDDGDFKVYGQENTLSGDFTKGQRWLTRDQFLALSNYHISTGDVLFTRKGSIGGCTIVPPGIQPGIIDSDTIRLRINKSAVNTSFILYAFKFSAYLQAQVQEIKRGAILSGLNTATIANLSFIVPPLPEQAAIAAYLDEATAKLDALVGKVEEAMERLQEYRTALITAAVTGKIDVGKAVPAASSTAGIG